MAKIRVLHVIGGGEIGGAEQLVLTLMKLLNRNFYDPLLLCLCNGPFAALAREEGINSRVIAMKHKLDLGTIRPIRNYLREEKIDIVHTHGVRANLVARLAAYQEGIPVVTTIHSMLRYDYKSYWEAILARCLTRMTNSKTNHFIAISGAIRDEIVSMGVAREKISLIFNGLDISKFKEPDESNQVKHKLGLDRDKLVISVIARLHPVKGHEYFLYAAEKLVKKGFNVQFLLIGEGFYRESLEKQIKVLGLDGLVKMPGYYTPVEDIYNISDIVCVPSIMEGLGMVVLEAMYFGVPVVASRIGGIPEIVENEIDGLLVEPRNTIELAGALQRIIEEPELAAKVVSRGYKKVQKFTQDSMARQVEEVYMKVKQN